MDGHSLALRNRKCFRVDGGPRLPLVMASNGMGIQILNAGFGMRGCRSSSRVHITLLRNSVSFSSDECSGSVIVGPGRLVAYGGEAKILALGSVGTRCTGS